MTRSSPLSPIPAIVADAMRPPLTTADQDDHAAATAYLMKHTGRAPSGVLEVHTGLPSGRQRASPDPHGRRHMSTAKQLGTVRNARERRASTVRSVPDDEAVVSAQFGRVMVSAYWRSVLSAS